MRPEDLFRVEAVGAIQWNGDRSRAIVEIRRPRRWLDRSIPTAVLYELETATAHFRQVSPDGAAFIGFLGAAWSPSGTRFAFLSADTGGVIRPWVSTRAGPPRMLRDLLMHDGVADAPRIQWVDETHVILLVRDPGSRPFGPTYTRIARVRDVIGEASAATRGGRAVVRVHDAGTRDSSSEQRSLVSIDVTTGQRTVLARGPIHRPRLSADGRVVTFRREAPGDVNAGASAFFGAEAHGDAAYDRVNWGGEIHHVDARTGAATTGPAPSPTSRDTTAGTLRTRANAVDGTQLVLSRPGRPDHVVWRGNAWVAQVDTGRAERVTYTSTAGRTLTGWFLHPRGRASGPVPVVTVVYPGTIHGARTPAAFDLLNEHFEHPQLLAAMGYGVVLPSMPEADAPMQGDAIDALGAGVLPLLDTLVARGIADSARIGVLGQSAGGYAVLGLLTRTNRFRTAIASASYANLTSLYGTFYGAYRHGDGGDPRTAQLLRMLQMERGYFGAGAPPWEVPERYLRNSPITTIANVTTPLMLVHGESDFIPVQQAEEVFTALFRRDRRVRLAVYAGETHTISERANVLDMWQRIEAWLAETMR